MAVSCADFEEMNHNPKAIGTTDAKPYWALNKSIIGDQQNPNDAERVFVLYWADLARQNGESYDMSVGFSSDEWAGCLYNITKSCVTSATNAINLVNEQLPNLTGHEAEFFPNVKAAAQIWRVYLMTEFVDSFGSFTTDFTATTPQYESVEACYNFMFKELAEAVGAINVNVNASDDAEKNGDPAYAFDPVKWKNFGISMWMRIAMRLSEVNATTAKTEFAKAVAAGSGIIDNDGNFRIQEDGGWNDLSGVMSRTWNVQTATATFVNLTTNFGGLTAQKVLEDPGHRFYASSPKVEEVYGKYIKDASKYLGIHMIDAEKGNLYEDNTDNPTKGHYFNGIPSYIDPRALAYFCLPGDYDNRIETGYRSFSIAPNTTVEMPVLKGSDEKYDITFSFNGLPAGWYDDDKIMGSNGLINGSVYSKVAPVLAERYRNCKEYRVFFGAWETYFLMAEAALRGYISGSAEDYYNKGIKASFDYLSLSGDGDANYNAYITGENYNRVGTSVKFSHTTEPADFQIDSYNPVTKSMEKVTYKYPEASKTLYGKALNDQLTKIITQKYIANTPWLPLETWSDHRRTGLPFWELPASSVEYSFLDGLTKDAYKSGQKVGYFGNRMQYPAKFNNASPEQYQNALTLMGMTNGENTITPLWWAKK